jgi:hypothetical protein
LKATKTDYRNVVQVRIDVTDKNQLAETKRSVSRPERSGIITAYALTTLRTKALTMVLVIVG